MACTRKVCLPLCNVDQLPSWAYDGLSLHVRSNDSSTLCRGEIVSSGERRSRRNAGARIGAQDSGHIGPVVEVASHNKHNLNFTTWMGTDT